MGKRELAERYFNEGYNCCQAVVLAFQKELGIGAEQAARLGSSFGGGLARLRELCGAVSGIALVEGLLAGYESPTDAEAKAAHYELIQAMANAFAKENGSYICRDLLALHPKPLSGQNAHNPACAKFVGDAAALVEARIQDVE